MEKPPGHCNSFWRHDSRDTDGAEWLDDIFYEQNHTIFNLEYAKLKMSNFAVKCLSIEPITALFATGATFSCISQQLFIKISNKVNMLKKSLKVNIVSETTLGPIEINPLELIIDDHILCIILLFVQNWNNVYFWDLVLLRDTE